MYLSIAQLYKIKPSSKKAKVNFLQIFFSFILFRINCYIVNRFIPQINRLINGTWNKITSTCNIMGWDHRNFSGLSAELGNIPWKENGGVHGNNASESHKLMTLNVLWLLILKTALIICDIAMPFYFIERSATRSTCRHVKVMYM